MVKKEPIDRDEIQDEYYCITNRHLYDDIKSEALPCVGITMVDFSRKDQ